MARGEHKRAKRIAELPDPSRRHPQSACMMALPSLARSGEATTSSSSMRDEVGNHWLMVHSGSRLMGQHVAGFFTCMAQQQGTRAALLGLDVASEFGDAYVTRQTVR